jgi:diguanylate cyclase (GGDEF)-like protein
VVSPDKALEAISKLRSDAQHLLLSPAEVDDRLRQIGKLLGGVRIGVRAKIVDVEHFWGSLEPQVADEEIDANAKITLALLWNDTESGVSTAEALKIKYELFDVVKDLWTQFRRNPHGGLTLKSSSVTSIFAPSIQRLTPSTTAEAIAVVYVDLDNFKRLNDSGLHEHGDHALRETYAAMHRLTKQTRGLAFFDGGDEFLLVIPTQDRNMILAALWQLRKEVQAKSFGPNGLHIGMTCSVVWRPLDLVCQDLYAVKAALEPLTKDRVGEKRRGTVTFEDWAADRESRFIVTDRRKYLELGICLSRCEPFRLDVFGDERLNFIAQHTRRVFSGSVDKLEAAIRVLTTWLDLTDCNVLDELPLMQLTGHGSALSHEAIALAVLHGISVARLDQAEDLQESSSHGLQLRWGSNDDCAVYLGGELVWGKVAQSAQAINYGHVGKSVYRSDPNGAVVGVQIGFQEEPMTNGGHVIPRKFFIDHIKVDNRPQTGGGLPDFWQVAVAQTISAVDSHFESVPVLMWGEAPQATETYQRLTGVRSWSVDEAAALADVPVERVTRLQESLAKRLRVVKSRHDLISCMYDAYVAERIDVQPPQVASRHYGAKLPRPMLRASATAQEDAVVCETAAQAYPIVIDTLRRSELTRQTRDDAGQELRELIGFKLKLTRPQKDTLPEYLRAQAADLDEYVERVFLSLGGILRGPLEAHNQVESFVNHLVTYIGAPGQQRSTRRACLVVPHVPGEDQQPRPLGLISVWASPRFEPGAICALDFVYVWRTVEAFIGFPYSLYGAICFADYLTQRIRETAGVGRASIALGELTYLAMSLHLGRDAFHARVAKRIVDGASD